MKAILLLTIIGAFFATVLGNSTDGFLELTPEPVQTDQEIQKAAEIDDRMVSEAEALQRLIEENRREIRQNALRAGMYGGTGL